MAKAKKKSGSRKKQAVSKERRARPAARRRVTPKKTRKEPVVLGQPSELVEGGAGAEQAEAQQTPEQTG